MAYISCPVCGKRINKYGEYFICPTHGCWKEDYVTREFIHVNPCASCEHRNYKDTIIVKIVEDED